MKLLYLSLGFILFSCTKKSSNISTAEKTPIIQKDTCKTQSNFHRLEKLFVIGDFDGDKKTDTIYQNNFSNLEKKEIVFASDPMKTDWDEVVKWFYNQDADITLTLNRKNSDILHLGTAQGLYCLINIGDNNNDGKDEIAFAIDKCDDSRTNTCEIYTLCNGKWQLLKEFGIREDAFDSGNIESTSIKGYLEKQNRIWKYFDYNQNEYDSPEEVGQMKVLKLDKCK